MILDAFSTVRRNKSECSEPWERERASHCIACLGSAAALSSTSSLPRVALGAGPCFAVHRIAPLSPGRGDPFVPAGALTTRVCEPLEL